MTWEELVVISRTQALTADHNVEDTLMVQLTRREIWILLYGLLWTPTLAVDLEDNACALLERLGELLDCQKPHWRTRDDGSQAA